MSFGDHYARAVRSGNLKSRPETDTSDSDVLGAAGLAGKRVPLAISLMRLLSGDNHAGREIVATMAGMIDGKAYRMDLPVSRVEAEDMARAVLAWVREGTCRACGGHGYRVMENTPTLSDQACTACKGVGKRPFDREFPIERRQLAQWILAEVERDLSRAGEAAMQSLAPRLDP